MATRRQKVTKHKRNPQKARKDSKLVRGVLELSVAYVQLCEAIHAARGESEKVGRDIRHALAVFQKPPSCMQEVVNELLANRALSLSRIKHWDEGTAAEMDKCDTVKDAMRHVVRLLDCITARNTARRVFDLLGMTEEEWRKAPLPPAFID